jgi:hypothetical protein
MKNKILILGAMLLLVMVTGCREESDTVYNYAFNDGLNFKEAEKSYAGKFKVLWNALNQNYAIWDYERSLGVDWDAVYDEYLPKYEELDKRDDVTDDELEALLSETVAPLHDGHFAAQMKNHQTGHFVLVIPSNLRVAQRPDFESANGFVPDLSGYLPTAQGGNGDIEVYEEANTSLSTLISATYVTKGKGYPWAQQELKRLKNLPSRTDKEEFMMKGLNSFIDEFEQLMILIGRQRISTSNALQGYNQLALTYQYLQIPDFHPIHEQFANVGISVKYALFRNKVAYFYLSGFSLTPYMEEEYIDEFFPGADAYNKSLVKKVHDVWTDWFDKVQELHAAGQLRGVIIDVRSNGGGMLNDYQYVLGSLLPSGGFEPVMARFKRGLGRYDFSQITPAHFETLKAPHAAITEPIVVLCNSCSVSMSELTSVGCKALSNGTLIGKTTHGGLCGLNKDPAYYSQNYAGIVGEQNVTPVWLYIPSMVTMSKEGKIFEGVGITPDIDVDLDDKLHLLEDRDTQLERAHQFLNTGK